MAGEDKLREYLKRVTVDLAAAKRRLAEVDARDHEPIAVIGMSCRFPEAGDPAAYWRLLDEGRATPIGDIPEGRFDHDPRAADNDLYTPRQGSFLPDVAGFDAPFFGFPPREALRMDPQQRLLMELAWEAMEDAGTPPASLAGSRTGVLLGFSDAFQYGQLEAERSGTSVFADPYMGQGSLGSVVAGRLAYQFDLRGPTFSLDTACSSTLVAVHLAAQALRGGECDYALAGGGYLALHPFLYVYSCATSLLSPTDRCHTFDASADGYMMGEGGGMVMLARLSDALRDGHRIRAVIRGSAVNQDGRSNGLTAPNRGAQVAVIRAALAAARTAPDEVAFVEAHGSGTPLGDEIELGALHDVFGTREAPEPLHVGAVKTNLGHTHTAAGIAGFIKTVLVLEHGHVPANLGMDVPAEMVGVNDAVRPAGEPVALDGPAVAGVSSFGWSGTNAHVVLETAPVAVEPGPAAGPFLLPVSAAGEAALEARLAQLACHPAPLADLAHTLATGRTHHAFRRAVVADGSPSFTGPGVRKLNERPRVAFLLPGVGDQYRGLGRELYASEPAFAAAVEECLAVTAARCGIDLRAVLLTEEPTPPAGDPGLFGRAEPAPSDDPLDHAEIAHPFLFTIEYALARLLEHRGVRPDVLMGYSLGEYVAACLAGVFDLADALWLVTERARLIEAAPAGRMLAVAAPAERIADALGETGVDVAALNGPTMTVLSGAPDAVEAAQRRLYDAGIAARPLRSAHAFHSSLLAPARDALAALVASVARHAPRIPIVSNATGLPLTDEQAVDPRYWAEHLCRPVRFADGVAQLAPGGSSPVDAFVEIGPGQTLGGLVRQNLPGGTATVLGTLAAPWPATDRPAETTALLETCGRLWELGTELHWPAFLPAGARLTELPPYPFQRTRFWPQPDTASPPAAHRESPVPAPRAPRPGPAGPTTAPGLCYAPVWRPDLARTATPAVTGTLVVYSEGSGDGAIGTALADLAEASGARVVEVVPGTRLRRTGRLLTIDPADPEHHGAVADAVTAGAGPVQVVHLWSLLNPAARPVFATDGELRSAVRDGFHSLLLAVQALGALDGVRLLTATAGTAEIAGGDLTAPDRALVHGFGRGVRAEYPGLSWRGVDLEPDADPAAAARQLAVELARPWTVTDPAEEPALSGWRAGRRWLKGWAELPAGDGAPVWDADGAYLITGGTRGLGMALARHLVDNGVRRLALVGRTDLDGRVPGAEGRQSLRDVAKLEAAGAQVLLLTADAGEPDQLRAALRAARSRFGELTGVVHAAGVPGGGLAQRQTVADAGRVLAPKVLAMGPLAELVGPGTPAGERPKLLVLYSSIATVLGGLGEGDYCAANTVLDAYGTALATAAPDTQVVTVAWGHWQHDAWQHEGTAGGGRAGYRTRYGFSDAAGLAVLDRLVGAPVHGAVAALRQALPEAHREWSELSNLETLINEATSVNTAALPTTEQTSSARFPRPSLRTEYAAPHAGLEARIAEVWGEYLGVDRVGRHDPFFDLGGNSLVGMAMVSSLERLLERRIAPAVLFGSPTVAAFTAALHDPAPAAPPVAGSSRGERRRRATRPRPGGTRTPALTGPPALMGTDQ